jgi:uncharacterized Zn finger protein (UPF0148 family)
MKHCTVCSKPLRDRNGTGFCALHYRQNWFKINGRAANKKTALYQKMWREQNSERKKQYDLQYYSENYLKYSLAAKARKRKLKQRTPKWLTEEQLREIYLLYKNCPEGYEVDHIVPINGKNVSGLHVPWNLQYLTCEENRAKSNKY